MDIADAIAELKDLVRCTCHPAYKDRNMHDPQCDCDSADAVDAIVAEIKRLRALTEPRPIEDAPINEAVLVKLVSDSGEERYSCLRLYEQDGERWWVTTDDESQISHNWTPKSWRPLPPSPEVK